VINRTEGLLEMRRAIFADRQQAICQTTRPFSTHAIEALAHGLRDSDCHALSSNARQLLGQSVCFLALDVQAHRVHQSTYIGNHSTRSPGHSIDRGGHVVYMGAIDATPSTRLADVKTAHNYVAAALEPGRASPKCFARAVPAAATSSGRTR
jgi:hypothetical protein